MSRIDLVTLLPVILIAAASVIIMLVVAFYRNHKVTVILTMIGLASAFAALLIVEPTVPRRITPLIILDRYALFYMGLIFSASFAVTMLSYSYLEGREGNHEEFYILLLLSTLGAAVLVASSHLASFFLGLEILSVSLYAFIAYLRTGERSIEAGIKYLILAAASAAFLLFGMALIYTEIGTMEFFQIASRIGAAETNKTLILSGLAMIIIGAGFKLAVVPFHMWTPDIYEGAPAPVTAFIATVSKGAVFALLLRYFTHVDIRNYSSLFIMFTIIAIASMFVGNLLALLQNNIKRILAYSSIAHLGYLLVAFLAGGAIAITAVSYYLAAYFVTTLGAFGIITVLSGKDRDADTMDEYRGLVWQRPWLAGIFTAMLLSLAGIPLTAGFMGKFYIVLAGVKSILWLLVIIMVINSTIGLYYYLRIVVTLYMRPTEAKELPVAAPSMTLSGSLVLVVLTLLLVLLGIYPSPLIDLIQTISMI